MTATDLTKIVDIDLRPAELGTHAHPFEVLIWHDAMTRSVVGIPRERLLEWSAMLGGGMLAKADNLSSTRGT